MILATDVGNTNIVFGVYRDRELLAHWRIFTDRNRMADEYGVIWVSLFSHKGIEMNQIKAIIISCVVPPAIRELEKASSRYFGLKPIIIDHKVETDIKIACENPGEVGADRIVNAVAGYQQYGGPLIIVDFGTATTFDAISRDGVYLGGTISPGIQISTEALFQYAAKLPRVELIKPDEVIGRNTVHSVQSGVVYGYISLVEGIIERMSQELEGEVQVIATGGLAELIAGETDKVHKIDPLLTLKGLRIIYERNENR